jgi:hypothetical protein
MSRRRVVLGVSAAAVVGFVAPSFAKPSVPVTVTVDQSNGAAVGTYVNGTPAAGASVGNGKACAGFGEQVPVCVADPGIVRTRQQLPPSPLVVRQDSNGTVVAVGEVGVVISNNGEVCPRVSTQDWICVNLG